MTTQSVRKDGSGMFTRRHFLSTTIAGASMATVGTFLAACAPQAVPSPEATASALEPTVGAPEATVSTSETGACCSKPQKDNYKIVWIQYMPHTVQNAWGVGIEAVTSIQGNVEYQLLDGQAKPDVQISLFDTVINEGVDVIIAAPTDSVALGPSFTKAREAGIPVMTLNTDCVAPHALHLEMNHYGGAVAIGEKMGEMMGGEGNVVIVNGTLGIAIRDDRNNGFLEGLGKYPDIEVIADQIADWDRKKAYDVFSAIMAANDKIDGVFGVNDSMALGAVDAAKDAGRLDEMVIFGDDGELDAIESIEKGELTGTQFSDVYKQGWFGGVTAMSWAFGGVSGMSFGDYTAVIRMPYLIMTQENAHTIPPEQRY